MGGETQLRIIHRCCVHGIPPSFLTVCGLSAVSNTPIPPIEQLVEMLRRLLLVGLMVLVPGMMQVIAALIASAMFLLFQVQASPYKDLLDDFLASSSSFALVMKPSVVTENTVDDGLKVTISFIISPNTALTNDVMNEAKNGLVTLLSCSLSVSRFLRL